MIAALSLMLLFQAQLEPAPPAEAGAKAATTTVDMNKDIVATPAQLPEYLEAAPAAEQVAPLIIPRDTPVHLMVVNEVSTKDHEPGHRFRLRVDKPVVIDGQEVIAVGTTAWGELTEAKSSGNTGKRGSLAAKLSHVELAGKEIPLEGDTSAEGKSGKGETILGVLALGPLGLFAKGNNAKIKAGERMTGFVAEDFVLEPAE